MKYVDEYTSEISFPLGGMGSGSIGLGGNGRFIDWEIFNRPDKGSYNGYSHFAVKAEDKDKTLCAKVLHSDMQKEYSGIHDKNKGFGYGMPYYSLAGMPHFKQSVFEGKFPFAKISFTDPEFPGTVKLNAFNPFIPHNEDDSSIPGAFFEVEIKNNTKKTLTYTVCLSVMNPFEKGKNTYKGTKKIEAVYMENSSVDKNDVKYGDMCIAVQKQKDAASNHQTNWYRGHWPRPEYRNNIETYWNEFKNHPHLPEREYESHAKHDTCSVYIKRKVAPKKTFRSRFVITWNIPNCENYWNPYIIENKNVTWKNHYAVLFKDSFDSAKYALTEWNRLHSMTWLFKKAIWDSSYPEYVKDAISSSLSILKSPTVQRLENGEFYGWEGCAETEGSCSGTCTHVYNYAYALPFLFPKLERSIRDLDYKYNLDETGRMPFRLNLPVERPMHKWRACVDGQMGGVIKTYREWKISGDTDWLGQNWEHVKKALSYAWSKDNPDKWDADKDGVLEGRLHNTLDSELFGPTAWLQGLYICALKAACEMAICMNEPDLAKQYKTLYENGIDWSNKNLFNGEYFIQKIDLSDISIPEKYGVSDIYVHKEKNTINYQIGQGCDINQLCGLWHANICGLGDIFDEKLTKTALLSMYKYNFRKNIRDTINCWRIYAVNNESAAINIYYPEYMEKPDLPVTYNSECMHGFEYQLAGLLISEGFVDEGLEIVKGVRDRYDGKKRNPWNEMECGSNYARSMAAYALVPILSGMRFDMTKNMIGFDPVISKDDFSGIYSIDKTWGIVTFKHDVMTLKVYQNSLRIKRIMSDFIKERHEDTNEDGPLIYVDNRPVKDFCIKDGYIEFEKVVTVHDTFEFIRRNPS